MHVAIADSSIAVWDAKYTWWTSRPITEDPDLKTLIPTPPYPAYPSGYSAVMGAGSTVIGHYFPEAADDMADRAWEAAASAGLGRHPLRDRRRHRPDDGPPGRPSRQLPRPRRPVDGAA